MFILYINVNIANKYYKKCSLGKLLNCYAEPSKKKKWGLGEMQEQQQQQKRCRGEIEFRLWKEPKVHWFRETNKQEKHGRN